MSLLEVSVPSRRVALTTPPNLTKLLARAAITARTRPGRGDVPDAAFQHAGVPVDADAVARYARVCGFGVRGLTPITYLHVISLPVQLAYMVDKAFGYPLPGLVHLHNEMTLARPVPVGSSVDVTGWATDLTPHRLGVTFDVLARVEIDGEPVWAGRSTYLCKGASAPEPVVKEGVVKEGVVKEGVVKEGVVEEGVVEQAGDAGKFEPLSGAPSARWRVSADTGRRYAAVSGDVNPIHLSSLTAKAFGSPKAIAHGMWAHARAIAALSPDAAAYGRPDAPVTATASFRKPILLPSTVQVRNRFADGVGTLDAFRADDTFLMRTQVR